MNGPFWHSQSVIIHQFFKASLSSRGKKAVGLVNGVVRGQCYNAQTARAPTTHSEDEIKYSAVCLLGDQEEPQETLRHFGLLRMFRSNVTYLNIYYCCGFLVSVFMFLH